MELAEYVDADRGRQTLVAAEINVQPQLLWQWARKVRAVPIPRCIPLEQATGMSVRRWDLRPGDWHRIWPELIGTEGAPAVPTAQPAAQEAA